VDSADVEVLSDTLAWLETGQRVALVTVVETWGSSPRPVGSLLAVREDGRFSGSVSGGCIEGDLVGRLDREFPAKPYLTAYGVTADEARQFGLPCGGNLRLVVEPVHDTAGIAQTVAAIRERRRVLRSLDLNSGEASVTPAKNTDRFAFDGKRMSNVHGPRWRLVLVGAGQLSRYLAQMAQMLDFSVFVTDPRAEYREQWDLAGAPLLDGMPDDAIRELGADAYTAILTTAHEPKVDDMALLEALKSDAFYVGALGSSRTNASRRVRLAMFDLSPEEIARLHGPAGIPLGSHTPAEIALSMLAEVVAVRNGAGAPAARSAAAS